MKLILFNIFFLLTLVCYAQSPKPKKDWALLELKGKVKSINTTTHKAEIIDGKYQNGSIITKESVVFNIMGFKTQDLALSTYNGSNIPLNLYFKYDAKGNRIEQMQDPGNSVTKFEYKFDAKGLIIEITSIDRYSTTTFYKYDNKGNVIETNSGENSDRTINRYNDKNQLVSSVQYDQNNNMLYSSTYQYDNLGNTIFREDAYKGIKTYSVAFVYDKKNQVIEQNETGNRLQKTSYYKYDNYGNQIEFITYDYGKYTFKATYKYVYDTYFNWTSKYILYNDVPNSAKIRKITYF